MNECKNCNKPTGNPKYCSKSCAVSKANKTTPKKVKKKYPCSNCGIPRYRSQRRESLCEECVATKSQRASDSRLVYKTVGEVREVLANSGKHPSWIHALIRTHARAKHKPLGKSCSACSYSKHVEVCHIKPISTFPDDALISDVNDSSNVLLLCRNCHWELDHGILKMECATGIEPAFSTPVTLTSFED